MAATIHLRNFWVIPLSILISTMLVIISLPDWGNYLRPDWVALTVLFWAIVLPRIISIGAAWGTGILLDVLLTTPMGQNALGLVIIVYIASRMHQQFLSAPLIQQAFFVSILLFSKQLLSLWINGMTGHLPESVLLYFIPSLVGFFVWPVLFITLRNFAQSYRLL